MSGFSSFAAVVVPLLFISASVLAQADYQSEKTKAEPNPGRTVEPGYYQKALSRESANPSLDEARADRKIMSADALVQNAVKAYQNGQFQQAVDDYLEAVDTFKKMPQTEEVKQKTESCKEAISKTYFHWAERLYFDACASADAGKFDEAIRKCEEAAEKWPACREKMDKAIQQFTADQKAAATRTRLSEKTIDPGKDARVYNIDVLMKQGDAFFHDRQYDRARDKYEQILSQDPYNFQAIDGIRKVNLKMLAAGGRRTNASRNEYIAENEWKMVSPGMARLLTMSDSQLVREPIVKERKESALVQKLNEIVLDNLEFDEVEAAQALKSLMERSRILDPKKIGVNIVFREGNEGTAAKAAGAAAQQNPLEGGEGSNAAAPTQAAAVVAPSTAGQTLFTGSLEGHTLLKAIDTVCRAAKLKYRIDEHAVVVAPQNVALDKMERRIYVLDNKELASNPSPSSTKKYFEDQGIAFGPGATAVYKPDIGRLIVNNTPEQLALIDKQVASMDKEDPQVLIEAKFVEVKLNDAEELGFHYSFSRANSNVEYSNTTQTVEYGTTNTTGKNVNLYSTESVNGYHPYLTTIAPGEKYTWGGVSTTSSSSTGTSSTSTTTTPIKVYAADAPLQSMSTGWGAGQQATMNRTINDISGYESRQNGLFGYQFYSKSGYKIASTVTALDQADSEDVLSCPRITTVSGFRASIKMVKEAYYPDSWTDPEISTDVNNSMFVPSTPEFGDATELGISLTVKPTVSDRRTIQLFPLTPQIKTFTGWDDYSYKVQEENDVDPNVPVSYETVLKMPRFEVKSVDTMVKCDDGETIIIGGIVQDSINAIDDQYPILGNLPLVGRFFQSKAMGSNKKNLLIFLTCRLIKPDGSPLRERVMRGLPPFRQ